MDDDILEPRYANLALLGRGAYGRVYSATSATGVRVAAKVVRFEGQTGGVPQSVIREISILKDLDNPHVVK